MLMRLTVFAVLGAFLGIGASLCFERLGCMADARDHQLYYGSNVPECTAERFDVRLANLKTALGL